MLLSEVNQEMINLKKINKFSKDVFIKDFKSLKGT